jgi:uncharacterized membrane protein (DUF485 family)
MIRTAGYIVLVVFLSFWVMDSAKTAPADQKILYAALLIVGIIVSTAIYIVRSFTDQDNN